MPTVFLPTIWTSNTPLGEIDIMGHKTNSTYATDFDVARNYHICSLFRVGMKSWGDLSFVNPQPSDAYGTGRDPEMNIGDLAHVTCDYRGPPSRSLVFATAMAKIVVKKGYKTVPPAQFLVDYDLLPSQEIVVPHESTQNSCEEEKFDDNNMIKIGENIEEIRVTGYQMAERLNALAEGCSFYNMSEKVFFSKR
ncbi:hypothetical protein N7471_013726 [Penicillium samsonianum]|uniref:uncharacterized protein n=1 Tax=Penicillium samsonianum TaxID=1882272 RepID=UPI0025482FF4|nr:uncharacterized protein N7471_013726 [Penicillium samsonianum]KAJ6118259.1 hypothetical protein N7471_013726 [Penicillium samsonianum]